MPSHTHFHTPTFPYPHPCLLCHHHHTPTCPTYLLRCHTCCLYTAVGLVGMNTCPYVSIRLRRARWLPLRFTQRSGSVNRRNHAAAPHHPPPPHLPTALTYHPLPHQPPSPHPPATATTLAYASFVAGIIARDISTLLTLAHSTLYNFRRKKAHYPARAPTPGSSVTNVLRALS